MKKYYIIWHYELDGPDFKKTCVCPAKNKKAAIDFVKSFDYARVIEDQQYSNIIIDSIKEVKE